MADNRPLDFGKFWYELGKELSDIPMLSEIAPIPLRSNEFVTQKIITNLIKVKFNLLPCIKLGNIYGARERWLEGPKEAPYNYQKIIPTISDKPATA